jgi:hypothetical protein
VLIDLPLDAQRTAPIFHDPAADQRLAVQAVPPPPAAIDRVGLTCGRRVPGDLTATVR